MEIVVSNCVQDYKVIQVSSKNMRSLISIALMSIIFCIMLYSCNAEIPSTSENPEIFIQPVRYMSRRAAQGGGGSGGASGGAGASGGMEFGFGVNIGGQGGGQADGQGGR
ncbi:uncharacterized protein LOC105209580 [Zeugodacus cucurbitae]|uniref:Uncharacterized protein n=1 Tax=Zeugodacus cucurbitae TaxID=28588 RepID=A0A0A1X9K7_ZEUCU|nr:uncharacterized protein LOC105209580 [Zeugodacus cucurbitae]